MTAAVKQWLEKERRKRDLDAELKAIKQELAVLEEAALEYLAEDGISNLKINGSTIYTNTSVYASLG